MVALPTSVALAWPTALVLAVAAVPPAGSGAPAPGAPGGSPPSVARAQEGIASSAIRWMRTTDGTWALAVAVEPAAGWHAYWENPGDSGSSPEITLKLPEGWTAGEVVYPRPDVAYGDDGAFYGYGSTVRYLVPVRRTVPAAGPAASPAPAGAPASPAAGDEPAGPGPWSAKAAVMLCKSRCVIANLEASGDAPTASGDALPAGLHGGSAGGRSLPEPAPAHGVSASIEGGRAVIAGPTRGHAAVRFIPAALPGLQVTLPEGAASVEGSVTDGRFRIEVPIETLGSEPGKPAFAGLVLYGNRPSDPCVRLALPHPTDGAASGAPVRSKPMGPGPDPGR
jgi:hypothetical protein